MLDLWKTHWGWKSHYHCHITGKFRGATHWNCNINLQLTRKVPAIFHNLRGYDSDLVFYELKKFPVKTQEFGFKNLGLLKQKDAYPYEYMTVLKDLVKKNYPIKNVFTAL